MKLMAFFSADAPSSGLCWLQHLCPGLMEIVLIDNSRCSAFVRFDGCEPSWAAAVSVFRRLHLRQAERSRPPLSPQRSSIRNWVRPLLLSGCSELTGAALKRSGRQVLNKRLEPHHARVPRLSGRGRGWPHSPSSVWGRELEENLRAAGLNSINAIERFAGRESIADRLATSAGWPEDLARAADRTDASVAKCSTPSGSLADLCRSSGGLPLTWTAAALRRV